MDTTIYRFYQSQDIADEVYKRLRNLGIQATSECACIRDSKLSQCEYGSGPCYNGIYIDVPNEHNSLVLDITTNQVERGDQ